MGLVLRVARMEIVCRSGVQEARGQRAVSMIQAALAHAEAGESWADRNCKEGLKQQKPDSAPMPSPPPAPQLHFRDVAADGNWLYRAVACQLETGEPCSEPPFACQVISTAEGRRA